MFLLPYLSLMNLWELKDKLAPEYWAKARKSNGQLIICCAVTFEEKIIDIEGTGSLKMNKKTQLKTDRIINQQ